MMKGDITGPLLLGQKRFSGYDDDRIGIDRIDYRSGLLLHANEIAAPWGPANFDALQLADLEPLLAAPPELLLLGTGRRTRFPSPEMRTQLAELPFACDWMDSRSAMRTYNVLSAEGRRVSIALLLPGA